MAKGGYFVPWTKEELSILWNNKEKSIKEIQKLIPSKTHSSVKNFKGNFSRLTDEKIEFILSNYQQVAPTDMDKELGLTKGTSRNVLILHNKEALFREGSATRKEVETIQSLIGAKTFSEIAKELNTTPTRIRNMASKLGLHAQRHFSDEEKGSIFSSYANGETLKSIAESLFTTQHMVKSILMQNGFIGDNKSSIYNVSSVEDFIMKNISSEFGVVFPDKSDPANKDFYWGIIPPLEVDIPFSIDGVNFAIEYNSDWWHKDRGDKDKHKKELLESMGYYFFTITSNDHIYHKPETMQPVLNMLYQAIRQIVKKEKERSTTIENIVE